MILTSVKSSLGFLSAKTQIHLLELGTQKISQTITTIRVCERKLEPQIFDKTGKNFVRQYVVPKQLREELLYRVHNSKFGGHLEMKATTHESRKRFYYPMYSGSLVSFVKNCSSCLQVKLVQKTLQTVPLQPIASEQSLPGDLVQIDLVGKLQPADASSTSSLEWMCSLVNFLQYPFALVKRKRSLEHFLLSLCDIALPSTIFCDLGSAFTSPMMRHICALLEVQIKYARVKHPQTIELLRKQPNSRLA